MMWLIWPGAFALLLVVMVVLGNRSRRRPAYDVAAQRSADANAAAAKGTARGMSEASHRSGGIPF